MSDVHCRKCGEPWDSYGITHSIGDGDLTPDEAHRFRKGEGCPSCHFASQCTACDGKRHELPGGYLDWPACEYGCLRGRLRGHAGGAIRRNPGTSVLPTGASRHASPHLRPCWKSRYGRCTWMA